MKKLTTLLLLLPLLPAIALATAGSASAAGPLDCFDKTQVQDVIQCLIDQSNNSPATKWYDPSPAQFNDKVFTSPDNEIFGERYTYAQVVWIRNSLFAMLTPRVNSLADVTKFIDDAKSLLRAANTNQPVPFQNYARLGPGGLFAAATTTMYDNPPASGIQELKSLTSKLLDPLAPSAHAQGVGFGKLNQGAIVKLWSASRNAAYFLIAALLIASGFMVMFKVKINPQTVITLQNLIPKLVMTLILITFSLAIAGFVIDLIYILIIAFVGMLGSGVVTDSGNLADTLTRHGFLIYVWLQIPLTLILIVITFFVSVVLAFVAGPWALLLILIPIVLSIIQIITLWKIFWMMLKAYITLLFQIIFGPLQITFGLLPGQGGFGAWLMALIAEASVFATIPIMLTLQHVLLGDIFSWSGGWNFNMGLKTITSLGGVHVALPFWGIGGNTLLFAFAGSFTIFTLTPKVAEMVKDALKVPPFKYGTAVEEAVGLPLKGATGFAVGAASKRLREGKFATKTERAIASGAAETLEFIGRTLK